MCKRLFEGGRGAKCVKIWTDTESRQKWNDDCIGQEKRRKDILYTEYQALLLWNMYELYIYLNWNFIYVFTDYLLKLKMESVVGKLSMCSFFENHKCLLFLFFQFHFKGTVSRYIGTGSRQYGCVDLYMERCHGGLLFFLVAFCCLSLISINVLPTVWQKLVDCQINNEDRMQNLSRGYPLPG